jgi:hypothetical protein
MLNKPQTAKLARSLNLFAQEVIEAGLKVEDLQKIASEDRALPIKQYKQVKALLEKIIGEYMASRDAGKFLAVVYESINPRVPDTAFGPFASEYEANQFRGMYEVMATSKHHISPGFVDYIPLRDPTWPLAAFEEAMKEQEESAKPAARPESEIWCERVNPFWEPPTTTAEVPAKLQKQVESFLSKAAKTGARIESGKATREQMKASLREEGEKVASVGGGWGALSYAFWRLRHDGITTETIHAHNQAKQNPELMSIELLDRVNSERMFIDELETLLAGALHGWMGIAGWAP